VALLASRPARFILEKQSLFPLDWAAVENNTLTLPKIEL
jgi:hypothetical protein